MRKNLKELKLITLLCVQDLSLHLKEWLFFTCSTEIAAAVVWCGSRVIPIRRSAVKAKKVLLGPVHDLFGFACYPLCLHPVASCEVSWVLFDDIGFQKASKTLGAFFEILEDCCSLV